MRQGRGDFLYWSNMSYRIFHYYIFTFSDFIKTQCLVFKIHVSQETKVKEIASSSFNFIPCLRYEIFGAGAQLIPFAPQKPLGILRRELRQEIEFQWKNNFLSEKESCKITHFWWKGLNWLSSCKVTNCHFREFCVTFRVLRKRIFQ